MEREIPSIEQTARILERRASPVAVSIFCRVFTATPQKAAASWIVRPDCVLRARTKLPKSVASCSS
jgi:hypothetical protein